MSSFMDTASIAPINKTILDFIENYQECIGFIMLFYKIFGREYVTLTIHEQLILKNDRHKVASMVSRKIIISFENLPQDILNQLVVGGKYDMILYLAENHRISFEKLSQCILSKVVLKGYSGIIALLNRFRVSFRDLPQEVLNRIVLADNRYTILTYLVQNGISLANFPQEVLHQLVMEGKYTMISTLICHGVSFAKLNSSQEMKYRLLENVEQNSSMVLLLLRGGVSFADVLSQDILIALTNGSYQLVDHFVKSGISFAELPQEVVNKIVLDDKTIMVSILGKQNSASFENLPQGVLNQIVANGCCLMVAILSKIGVSFVNLPQELLNRIVINENYALKQTIVGDGYTQRNLVSTLVANGVSFRNLPIDVINRMMEICHLNNYKLSFKYMIYDLISNGVSFTELSQVSLIQLVTCNEHSMVAALAISGVSFTNIPSFFLRQLEIDGEVMMIYTLKKIGVEFV